LLKNSKKAIKIMGVFVLVFIIIYLAASRVISSINDDGSLSVDIYFLNPTTSKLELESYKLKDGERRDIVGQVFSILQQAPKNKNLVKTMNDSITILEIKIAEKIMDNNSVLELEFSESYRDMSAIDELFFRSSLVWSMTGLDFIDSVHIYVNGQELLDSTGEPMGLLNRSNVLIDPQIAPKKAETQEVVVYFSDQRTSMLTSEKRVITVDPNQPLEWYILKELIAGPQESNNLQLIPSETKIQSVKTEENVCYVNLSNEFVSRHPGGAVMENLTVYGIVNSLTELSGVRKVQLLVEGKKLDTYKGTVSISDPLERDESLIGEE